MNLLIFCFIVSAIRQTSLCYDLEIEGTVQLGKDFIKELMKNEDKQINKNDKNDEKNDDEPSMRKLFNASVIHQKPKDKKYEKKMNKYGVQNTTKLVTKNEEEKVYNNGVVKSYKLVYKNNDNFFTRNGKMSDKVDHLQRAHDENIMKKNDFKKLNDSNTKNDEKIMTKDKNIKRSDKLIDKNDKKIMNKTDNKKSDESVHKINEKNINKNDNKQSNKLVDKNEGNKISSPAMRRVFNANLQQQTLFTTDPQAVEEEEMFFHSVAEIVAKSGVQQLKNVAKYLSYKCDIKKDANLTIRSMIADYVNTFRERAKELCNNYVLYYDLDKEYTLLNLIEISSILFYRKEKAMLKEMLNATNKSVFDLNTFALSEKIHANFRDHRSNGMRIICEKYKKCREYPGFSDRLGELIHVILKLPTSKLLTFFEITKKLLLREVKFVGRLLESDILDGILKQMKSFEVPKIRSTLNLMRSVIISRYKLLFNTNEERVNKNKAARILLDILDKTFYVDGQDLQSMEFGTLIKSLEQWTLDQKNREELAKSISSFLQHILNTFKHQWEDGVANEINTLMEIVLLGKAKDDFSEKYLLNKGSLFVRNKLLHSDVEVGLSDYARF
ncbi:uncharacterized protein LOC128678383 isoform X2 [Plodia interpunctella]|nr:uncharacterized protein LOC128678383 isoform X1 [Plodia interpunctella]XP_053615855.1 uncharacterized protein LOC128678383 isoform X1 [Plodia interpunctella]XP_053615857.1 uncharacterized protein LOC128678383 isoform X1 [Plodia interpunctella]